MLHYSYYLQQLNVITMPTNQYLVNSRAYTSISTIGDELTFDPNKNYLFDLSYLGCIDVVGERASEFLQGQLSCDLREVTQNQMRQGAMCNLKGRILALLDVIDWHGLHLIVPNDLLAETQASLAKTATFSKVTLNTATDIQLFGFYMQNRDDMIPFNATLPETRFSVIHEDAFSVYHLGDGYYIFITKQDAFVKKEQMRGSLAWHVLRLRQKQFEIYPKSRGLFLPHRLDLQLSGYLNFNKGCYKGQEIVARTHYRAKLKHEMKLFTIQTSEPIQSGQNLFSLDDHVELGEVIDYCPVGKDSVLIAASVVFDCPSNWTLEKT